MLRLVGTDGHSNATHRQRRQRIGHTGKGQIGRRGHHGMAGAEFGDLLFGVAAMRAHHGGDHRFTANRIHRTGHRRIGAKRDTACRQHGIDNCAGDAHTIYQRAIKIEQDMARGFTGGLRCTHAACVHVRGAAVKN